jgi:hypothetical protein
VDKDSSFLAGLSFWGDLLEINDELLWVVLGVGEEFGRVQSENVVGNSLGTFVEATRSDCIRVCTIADSQELVGKTEMSVEPVYLSTDEICGHESSLGEDLGDLGLLVGLEGEG